MSSYQHTPNSHTRRILVVGAGPAGLAAAHYLKSKGYEDITVVDAGSTVGGKCQSVLTRGTPFDLGASFTHYGYITVRELAEHYHVAMKPAPALVLASTDKGKRGRLGLPLQRDLKTVDALARFATLLVENRALWNPGFMRFDPSIAAPIPEWMDSHKLSPLSDVLLPAFTGYGYGYPEDLPAAYLLKMVYHIIARNAADNARWMTKVWQLNALTDLQKLFDPLMFKDGFDSLCQAMAAPFSPRLNVDVKTVSGDENGVSVEIAGEESRYNAVILAVPPSVISRLVQDTSISSVFSLATHDTLHNLLLEVEGFPEHETWFLEDNARQGAMRGHAVRVADLNPGSGLCSAIAYGADQMSVEKIESTVRHDLSLMGFKPGKQVAHQQWQGAAHATSESFIEFHDRVESLQGLNGVFFTGEVMDGGSVEGAMAYSKSLVERFF